MLRKLKGRNLAHLGCLIGLIIGVGGGLLLVTLLLVFAGLDATIATGIWLGLSFILGATGWVTGATLSSKYNRPDIFQSPPDSW